MWAGAFVQSTQFVERLDDGRVSAEEDPNVDGLERLQTAIGSTVRLARQQPAEEAQIEPDMDEARLEARKTFARKADLPLFMRAQQPDAPNNVILAGGEQNDLPRHRQIRRQFAENDVVDQNDENRLVELASELIFAPTPVG